MEKDLKPFSPFCSPLKSTALNMSNLTSLPLSMSYKSSVDSLYSPAKSSVSKTPSTASNTSSALSCSVRFKPTSLLLKPKASATSTGNAARKRVSRRLTFDEDKSSPVSGTLIRELADGEEIPMYQTGKIQ